MSPTSPRRASVKTPLKTVCAIFFIALVTLVDFQLLRANPSTAGFTYLVAVLLIASYGGAVEAVLASVLATGCLDFFFIPPLFAFTVADSQNWVALLAMLATALIGSRLAARAREQTHEARRRQDEMELLYSLSRTILLAEPNEIIAKRIPYDLVRIFDFSGAGFFDARTGQLYATGWDAPALARLDSQLREAAVSGMSKNDGEGGSLVFAIRLGGQPIGSMALFPARISSTAIEALANLVAITMERFRVQEEANARTAELRGEALKSTLLDAIAHEFKTPLTSIKAASSSLASSPSFSVDRVHDLGNIISEESDRLDRLVTEAIQMSRIESGKVRLNRSVIQVSELVSAAVARARSTLDGHPLSVSIPPGDLSIAADVDLIELALGQLLDNAAKYSGTGTPIEVSVARNETGVILQVVDSGRGIPEAEQDRIFQKFHRSVTSPSTPGTGIGLHIVREIVRAHGGQVWVESRPGQGARFSLMLPVAVHAEVAV